MEMKLGDKLKFLRKELQYTQKEFAKFLNIPQPSLSAYENNKNSPTMEVLINISTKCNISLDWLCGVYNDKKQPLNTLGDLVNMLYAILELKEIKININVDNKSSNDIKTDNNKWFTQLTIFENDKLFPLNADLSNIIASINETLLDLET